MCGRSYVYNRKHTAMRTTIALLLNIMALQAGAQEIFGKISDQRKEPLIDAEVLMMQGNVVKYATCTDYDGLYIAKPLQAGMYNVTFLFTGYDSVTIQNVIVSDGRTTVNTDLGAAVGISKNLIKTYYRPKVQTYNNAVVPTTGLTDIVEQPYGLYSCGGRRSRINVGGPRIAGTLYIIDGVEVQNIQPLPMPDPYKPRTVPYVLNREEVKRIPTTELKDIVALSPLVYQRQRGADVQMGGSDAYGTLYVVDGMQIAR